MDDTLKRLRDWNLKCCPHSPAYDANQYFMNSLRKYPDPARYSNLIERLLRSIQNKHINKIKNASKINKTSSKRTQTFNKTNNISIENILSVSEYEKMFFVNHFNQSYDYLNASRDQRSTWLVPSLEARYLHDLKKYIKRKLRQICDEALPLDPLKKSEYTICYQPKPCSCNNARTSTTPRNSYDDRLQKEITEWTSKLPIYLDDSSDNNQKRIEMVDALVSDIQRLRNYVNITEFNDKVKNIAENFLNEYPMWFPQDSKKREEFIYYLVDDLINKLNTERKNSKDMCGSEEDILKMFHNITANESKEDITQEVLKRLKPLALDNSKDNKKYKEDIKTEAIEILNKMSQEKNIDSRDDVIRDLAEKISDYLSSMRRQESQSSQTDKEDNMAIKSEAKLKRESKPMFKSSISDHAGFIDNDIERQSSNKEAEQANNQLLEAHASKSSLGSFSRMHPTEDTANITKVKQVPLRKSSLKFSHKRWMKKERSKRKGRKDSFELKNTIEDQVVRANKNIENTISNSSLTKVNNYSEMINDKSVYYPEDRTMSAIDNSKGLNVSNKSTVDVELETTASEMKNESTHHPNNQNILEAVQEWIDNLPVNLNETKETLARSLTSDIEVRQKFKDMKLDNENDDVGFLKYYIFKHLCQVLSNEKLAQVIHEVDDLMKKLDNLNIISNTKIEKNATTEIGKPSDSQNRRKSITNPADNKKTNEGAYMSGDEEQNDFISTNIHKVVDKNFSKQAKEQTSLNNDDYDLLQQIRERSMLYTDQSNLDDISKEIAKKTNISELNAQENKTGNDKKYSVTVTQTKNTVEKSSQMDKELETTIPTKNSEYFDDINQNDVAVKGEMEKSRRINKCQKAEDRKGHDEFYQSEIIDSFPNCTFCRTKYAAEARKRCKRLKRKHSLENVDDEYTFCPKCGLKCSYPSRMFFC